MSQQEENRVLLPTDIKPILYHLTIEPDLKKFTFNGTLELDYKLQTKTDKVVLNSKDLDVKSCLVHFASGKEMTPTKISYDKENEYVIFNFDEELKEDGTLKMTYDGELNDKMVGFYRSSYEYKGEKKHMGTTQFEPTDARRAFPCFDEPAIKAKFEVILIVPDDLVALSNMPIVEETKLESESKKEVRFDITPLMSTYLLAFVVGDFEYIEDKTKDGLPIRVYTQVGKTDRGKFALDVAVRTIPLYEQYFDIKYPLPKLDMIAIPDFAAGAMENWGLVTYRDTALLVDTMSSSTSSKQWVALVVTHEIGHSWFGNLCTMEWWKDLYLNESFATYAEYWATDKLFPSWKVFEQFVDSEFARAQELDGLASTHAIEVPIRVASEVDEIFDAISYAKGCSVVRMLVNFLGHETFRKGLIKYLKRFEYANATSEDLWKALSESSGKDVSTMMLTWTKNIGYPVVTVEEQKVENNKHYLTVEQSRFLISGPNDDKQIWHIPFSYITSSEPNKVQYVLLTDKKQSLIIEGDFKWIKFNPNQTGFYRVKYPKSFYKNLRLAIEDKSLSNIDRLGLLNDLLALAQGEYETTDTILDILESYKDEDNYIVWKGISTTLSTIYDIIKKEPYADKFVKFARNIFKKQGEILGWKKQSDESHLTSLLRALVIGNLSFWKDEKTIAESKAKFEEFLKDKDSVEPDLRSSMYGNVIYSDGSDAYDKVMNLYKTSDLHEEKVRCLGSFGKANDKSLLEKTLKWSLTDEVRSQDIFYCITSISHNPVGSDLTWNWFKDNIETLRKMFEGGFIMGRLIKLSCSSFTSDEKIKEVEDFLMKMDMKSVKRSIDQAIEKIKLNSKWLKRDSENISKWINDNVE